MGDKRGSVELWDVENKKPYKVLKIAADQWVTSTTSTNNIVAIGSYDKKLRLYDVSNWECFYVKECGIVPGSLHLTRDLKYLTIAGLGGDGAYVMNIE
eukprot:CAMPEP_0197049686 /NCGR_PEP_ID=MMETSP1384-20130603/24772_1 /TAXON_ID=29189 /ORGANISM="Ammonia sp." /LENGTH=97 /DNA_ID=CAMNT_0042482003 /DNA_START=18 /DNA_END=311 /DNA_ORIENTATION=-